MSKKWVKRKELKSSYYNYLQSDIWKLKRNETFTIKGKACQKCKSVVKLNVHHGTYENLGNEHIEQLFVLCDECHIEYHKIIKSVRLKNSVSLTATFIDNGTIGKRKKKNAFSKRIRNKRKNLRVKERETFKKSGYLG